MNGERGTRERPSFSYYFIVESALSFAEWIKKSNFMFLLRKISGYA